MEVMQLSYSTEDHKTNDLPEILNAVLQVEHTLFSSKVTAPFCLPLTSEQPSGCKAMIRLLAWS